MNSGMQEEVFAAPRSINEISIKGRDKPYFQNNKKEPLQFQVSFAFAETWDKQMISDVARWLTEQAYYQPLFFSDDPEKIYYALCVNDPTIIHNGLNEGYLNLTFRCDAPYAYSPLYTSPVHPWRYQPFTVQVQDTAAGEKNKIFVDAGGIRLNPSKTMLTEFRSKKLYEI
ncbi:Phage tail protein [compost metagenome]